MLEPKDYFTLSIAVAGLLLGIYNARRAHVKDTPKIVVEPFTWVVSGKGSFNGIKVTNKGSVGVTLSQVGLRLKHPKNHWLFISEEHRTGNSLPYRLEPRTAVQFGILPGGVPPDKRAKIKCAFATTECGIDVEGVNDTLFREPELAPTPAKVGYEGTS